jgi:hypothetical protein
MTRPVMLGRGSFALSTAREGSAMAYARVVTFEGVGKDRIEEMRGEMDGDPPEGLPAKEIIVLHDPDARFAEWRRLERVNCMVSPSASSPPSPRSSRRSC